MLAAHNTAGEKDRKHPHYLKGSIWCGECGARLIYSRNRGRGGVYEYFFCLNRKMKRRPCQRGAVRVDAVAAGVEDFYQSFQLNTRARRRDPGGCARRARNRTGPGRS